MFLTFPDDENTYGMDDQFMVGESLLVKPVTEQGQNEISVYLPTTSVCIIIIFIVKQKNRI